MSTIGSNNLTLLDRIKRTDPNGRIASVVELLSQTNEVLTDAVHKPANGTTSHRTTIRTGLPTVYTRALNQYVPSSKSNTAQIDEGLALFEAFSQIDEKLVDMEEDKAAFRLSEDLPFIEAMNQAWSSCLFYGNSTHVPTQFMGLSNRYNALTGVNNSENVLDAGGRASDNTSIWLVVWGDNTVFCPYPKGSQVGLSQQDLGIETSETSEGLLRVYRSNYRWNTGLVVRDWRYVVRIPNIKIADLKSKSGTQAITASTVITDLMTDALNQIPNLGMGKPVFYMNRTVFSGLQKIAQQRSSNVLNIVDATSQFGTAQKWLTFTGVPLRRCDALVNTEAAVS